MLDIRFLENIVATAHVNDKISFTFDLEDGKITLLKNSKALILKEVEDRLWCKFVFLSDDKFQTLYTWVYAVGTRESQYMGQLFKSIAYNEGDPDMGDSIILSLKDEQQICECYNKYLFPY